MALQSVPPIRPRGGAHIFVPSVVEASSSLFNRLVKVPLTVSYEKLMEMPPLRRYLAAGALATCVFWIAPFKIIPFTKSSLLKLFLGSIPPTESGSGFNIRQKLWYSCVWLLSPKHPKTYSLQDALPSLPVPDLNQTCNKFLQSVRPLLTDEEYAVSKQKLEEFKKKDGNMLHNNLWKYSFTVRNWIEETWEWGAYLSQRSPLPVYSNWYGIDGNSPDPANRFVRLGALVVAAIKFKRELDIQAYETLRMSLVPICMHQYTRLFGTSRNPGLVVEGEKDLKKSGDYLVTKPNATAIMVMCRGEIYIMQAARPTAFSCIAAHTSARSLTKKDAPSLCPTASRSLKRLPPSPSAHPKVLPSQPSAFSRRRGAMIGPSCDSSSWRTRQMLTASTKSKTLCFASV